MFIDANELIEIKIYYKKIGRHYLVNNKEDYGKLKEEEQKTFKCLTVKAKDLTWGVYNELNEESVVKDDLGNRQWNFKLYKENKLRTILVEWDAKTASGKGDGEMVSVPINEVTIKSLSPDIAECILNSYDRMMFIGEEEEKK